MKIFSRIDSKKVVYENEKAQTLKECVELAVDSRANLSGSNLSDSDLRESDLSASDLSGANLSGSNLSASDLSGANLSGSNLSESDLSESDLRDSNLSASDLSGANLSGSNLSDSDLRELILFNTTGNNREIRTIQTGKYIINIVEDFAYMQIGCERHSLEDWFNFTDREIVAMDGKEALKWWRKWKQILKLILETD